MGTRSQASTGPSGLAYNSEPGVARSVTAARSADPGGVAAGIIAGAQAAAQTGVVAGACEHIDVGTVTYGDVQVLLAASAGSPIDTIVGPQAAIDTATEAVIDTVVADGDGGIAETAAVDEPVLVEA